MAAPLDQSNQALANRLIDHADSITNHAAHEMEMDMDIRRQYRDVT